MSPKPTCWPRPQFVLGLPGVVGAIAACRPENMDFVAQIERLSELPHVKGVRRILHQSPDGLSQTDLFIENLRHLPDYDLSFDLCLRADQLHIGLDHAQKAPDVQFILDHCGNPRIAEGELDPWRREYAGAGALPQCGGQDFRHHHQCGAGLERRGFAALCRASDRRVRLGPRGLGLGPSGGDAQWHADRNGSRRPMPSSPGCSEDEKAKLLHRNAERIYGV